MPDPCFWAPGFPFLYQAEIKICVGGEGETSEFFPTGIRPLRIRGHDFLYADRRYVMRIVDVLYGLPYILLVVMLDLALQPAIRAAAATMLAADLAEAVADMVTLLLAIGGVSWLTMARVIRGQVLSLRAEPFVEAARACGAGTTRIIVVHILPNLIGPIVVYTTLTVPSAILQESFLSFLGIGVQAPLPSWGNLASEGVKELHALGMPGTSVRWWLPLWPCLLLGITLMALNFLGDALRERLDPRGTR